MFFRQFPYHKNAILDFFIPLSNKPWAMLLHSGYSKHKDARFDILVASPNTTLTTTQGITIIHNKNKNYYKKSNNDPFFLLKKEIELSNMQSTTNPQLPFQGGYVGIFGYDLIRNIENLPKIAKKDINLPDMAIGLYRWAIIADHKYHTLQLISHDEPNELIIWLNNLIHSFYKDSFTLKGPWISNITRNEYSKKFHIIHKHLKEGNCYQICLSQRFSAPYIGNEWIAFEHLLRHNYAPFSAFIRLPDQVILSLSPERFLCLQNSNIKTQPIKGTISRSQNHKIDDQYKKYLANSNKNKAENLMIVDLLRNDIGRVAIPGSIQVQKLFEIQTFPSVHHMVSTITGQLNSIHSAYDLLRACFPGGSITGAPKITAMKIIEELEPHRRNAWSGSIGYISCCGNMDTNIAIRTLLAENNTLFCSVGSGITFDSQEKTEYQEMITKVSTLLPLLNTPIIFSTNKINTSN
ncbi:aminodeoxychorismate synthase component I [Blochmannia endosymbiont of Polyrhachis (Hedomyrma) turneri]|uniref:aminodeoxychorismate synthase component I n=1 Tax=Blochmannia endosymbiont of Polyrhachis (Hedomyrma) turneri TaxID=1505596 RepID=UPI00061A7416|nr:aminodeoxychorismate synthase component I [Blochmannia endosymbiont of Polyrhachis (Hedomyrma) turneri]AKC60007.1 Para-aminobenzoate synthase component 1 [Blochmannia endosymbiont of Polyrhachis (Hedomyrma) turneri]